MEISTPQVSLVMASTVILNLDMEKHIETSVAELSIAVTPPPTDEVFFSAAEPHPAETPPPKGTSPLSTLPLELKLSILTHLDPVSSACLAVTSSLFYAQHRQAHKRVLLLTRAAPQFPGLRLHHYLAEWMAGGGWVWHEQWSLMQWGDPREGWYCPRRRSLFVRPETVNEEDGKKEEWVRENGVEAEEGRRAIEERYRKRVERMIL